MVQLIGLGTFTARSGLQSLIRELRSCVHVYMLSCFRHIQLFATLWTVAHQALLSLDSSGRNTGVGFHALLQQIFLTQGSNPCLMSPALAGRFFTTKRHLGSPQDPASCAKTKQNKTKQKNEQCSFGCVSLSKSFHLASHSASVSSSVAESK